MNTSTVQYGCLQLSSSVEIYMNFFYPQWNTQFTNVHFMTKGILSTMGITDGVIVFHQSYQRDKQNCR